MIHPQPQLYFIGSHSCINILLSFLLSFSAFIFLRCGFLKMSWLYEWSLSFCRFSAALMSTKSERHKEIFVSIFFLAEIYTGVPLIEFWLVPVRVYISGTLFQSVSASLFFAQALHSHAHALSCLFIRTFPCTLTFLSSFINTTLTFILYTLLPPDDLNSKHCCVVYVVDMT